MTHTPRPTDTVGSLRETLAAFMADPPCNGENGVTRDQHDWSDWTEQPSDIPLLRTGSRTDTDILRLRRCEHCGLFEGETVTGETVR